MTRLAHDPTAAALLSDVPCYPVPLQGGSPALDALRAARVGHGLAVGKDGVLLILRRPWLALDIPVTSGLEPILDQLDEEVVSAGGRLYLAKDARMRPELVPEMYPRLDEWRASRNGIDPDGRFRSDMSRRLGLT